MPLLVRGSTYENMLTREKYLTERVGDLRNQVVELKKRNEAIDFERDCALMGIRHLDERVLPLLKVMRHELGKMKETLGEQEKHSVNLTEIAGSEIFQLQVRALSQACAMYAEMAEWVESLIPSLKKSAQSAARERAESFYRQMYTFLEEYGGLVGKEEELAETIQNTPPITAEIGSEEENKWDEPPILVGSVVWHTTPEEEEEEKLGYE